MSRAPSVIALITATLVGAACRPARPQPPQPPVAVDDRASRLQIAHAEARRVAGTDELIALAQGGAPVARMLAIRGLGRIGGARAVEVLEAGLSSVEPGIAAASASALGVASLLDETPPTAALTNALVATLARVPEAEQPLVIEAIGRAADASAQLALVPHLTGSPAAATATALALARYGRRKIAHVPAAVLALLALAEADQVGAYAAVYALARAHKEVVTSTKVPAWSLEVWRRLLPALLRRLTDEDPETRVQAAIAIVRQNLVAATDALPALARALHDPDWRVAVEAVRALTDDRVAAEGQDAVAAALLHRYDLLERGAVAEAHVVLEGLRALGPYATRPQVAVTMSTIAARVAATTTITGVTNQWIACLSSAALLRGAPTPELTLGERCTLPDHLRLPLVAELVTARVGSLAARRRVLGSLIVHRDPRVRAAALPALVALWDDGTAMDRDAMVATLSASLAAPEAPVVGAAIEAASTIYAKLGEPQRLTVAVAIVARATREDDPELATSLLDVIGAKAIAPGVGACQRALAGVAVVRRAAGRCLSALGEPAAAALPQGSSTSPPPVELAAVVGRVVVWTLTTVHGPIEIELRPDVAPWAVATIVHLTRAGFYDGLELHRVVPGFVAQGGDPTMSGWGGPGFTLPSEPGSEADGPGFTAGAVGIADAGRDSGGSQWFVMHGRAAHLDGRYTWIGSVRAGQKSADALQIGDRIEAATVVVGD